MAQPMEAVKIQAEIIGLPNEERVGEIENLLLQGVFGCRTTEAAVTYAQFLSSVGITPERLSGVLADARDREPLGHRLPHR